MRKVFHPKKIAGFFLRMTLYVTIFALITIARAHANETCAVSLGGCGNRVYKLTYPPGASAIFGVPLPVHKGNCESLPAICKAPDFKSWTDVSRTKISGSLKDEREVDDAGTLKALSGQSVSVCYQLAPLTPWISVRKAQCPLMKGDADGQCGIDEVAQNGQCVPRTPSGDFDGSGSIKQIGQGFHDTDNGALHNFQAQDVSLGSNDQGLLAGKTVSNVNPQTTNGVNAGVVGVGGTAGTGGSLDRGALGGGAFSPAGGSGGFSGGAGTGGSGADLRGLAQAGADGARANADLTNALLAGAKGGSAGSGAAGGANGLAGNSIGGGGSVSVASAGKDAAGFETIGGKLAGAHGGAGRSPASAGGGASGEDPADYFTRTGLDTSLFKVVERRYRDQQAKWILVR